jgi:hypothetical protein
MIFVWVDFQTKIRNISKWVFAKFRIQCERSKIVIKVEGEVNSGLQRR